LSTLCLAWAGGGDWRKWLHLKILSSDAVMYMIAHVW
jgi:hypothetical protein